MAMRTLDVKDQKGEAELDGALDFSMRTKCMSHASFVLKTPLVLLVKDLCLIL